MLRTRTPILVATTALALGVGVGVGASGFAAVSGGQTTTVATDSTASNVSASTGALAVGEIYERANDGVVEITATSGAARPDVPFPSGGQQTQQAQGSGFVYDTDGHVVTNYHVVEGATSVEVAFADGSTHRATVVGSDPSTDLAVLKVDASADELHPLALGDSDAVAVGDGVVAIGSPFGLEETVTSGIVSALSRTIESTNGYSIPGAIQTDAAINHGNSGGPLLNLRGQVIGVTSQIESESGGNVGIGFAIPSNTVRSVVEQIVSGGKVEHAYLGVSIGSPKDGTGALIGSVTSGSPAAAAGLRAGDVITEFDGRAIASPDALTAAVAAKTPGAVVDVTYVRGGKTATVQATLGTRPA
jgi:putative serine protease PepD